MSTLSEMIDEVKGKLSGYTIQQDRITYLNNPSGITTTSTSLTVGSQDNFSKGIIEIEDELMWIDSYNKSSSTLTVIPGFGRGYGGTTPAPHNQYSKVIISPSFPRRDIKKAINDTIQSLFPKLFATDSTTFSYNTVVNTYSVPDDAQNILSIKWETIGPSKDWRHVKAWDMNPTSNVNSFNSNNSVIIKDPRIPAGRTVMVHYSMEPNILTANTEDFATVTGLPQSCEDVVILGATARLLSFIDPGRINTVSAEADLADSKVQVGSSTNASKYIYALFQQRLKEESNKLYKKFPVNFHYTTLK